MIHVVAGPTAAGKTAYAAKLAQKLNGVLINVDSRQIYKYLDIGTNKDPFISAELTSFLEPDQQFSAFAHRDLVCRTIERVESEGKVPILVGGSGLYLDVILHAQRYIQSTEANTQLRQELATLNLNQLQERLLALDPDAETKLNSSDWHNPRRITRYIEKLLAASPTAAELPPRTLDFKLHYIDLPREQLFARINDRVEDMWQQGLVQEVKDVLAMGYTQDAVALQGIGYRQVLSLLRGEIDEPTCISQIQAAHRQYAKRQQTWFRKYLPSKIVL